ncbi:hypothetical protein NBRC116589_43630 [Ruegeria sp. HU-ET01832]
MEDLGRTGNKTSITGVTQKVLNWRWFDPGADGIEIGVINGKILPSKFPSDAVWTQFLLTKTGGKGCRLPNTTR